MEKRTSILSDLKRNYDDTKSVSKSVDLTAKENKVNPHKIYNDVFKNVDKTPSDYPTEKVSVGDVVYMNDDFNQQFEVISINNKSDIIVKNLSNNETIKTSEDNIKKIMENIDMAKKKINETQYSVSINGLETTDANALSQMMSAAAQADSGNADVGGMDMTSTPELPTPEMDAMDPAVNEPITSVESIPPAEDSIETFDEEPSFEDSDIEGMDDELPTNVENPLDNTELEMDSFEDDFEPVVDDIEFDEEITPTEDELEMDIEEPVENDLEIYESKEDNAKLYSDDKLARYEDTFGKDDEISNSKYLTKDQLIAEINKGNLPEEYTAQPIGQGDGYKIDFDFWTNNFDENIVVYIPEFGYDEDGMPNEDSIYSFKDFLDICKGNREYALQLLEDVDWQSPETLYDEYNWEDEEDEEINEDILLPKATEDETFVAKKKLENDKEDEESERISESMDALIKSILESADAKSEQEIYAEEISEADEGEDEDYEEIDDDAELEEVRQMFMSGDFTDDEIVEELVNRGFPEDFARDRIEEWASDGDDVFGDDTEELEETDEEILDEATKKLISGRGTTSPWTIGHSYDFNANKSDILKSLKNIANRAKDLKMTGDSSDEDKRYSFEFDEDNYEIWDEQVEPLLKEAKKGSRDLISIYKDLSKVFKENIRNDFVWHSMIHYLGFHEQWKPNWVDEKDWGKLADSCAAAAVLANATNLYAKHASKIMSNFDKDIEECLKNAGVKPLKESIVKPTIVTDESSFANKPNKALKPEDEKTVKTKTVDTATFGKDASEGFKEPLNCIKCEAVSPKEKIKAIFETARTRYAKADKSQWNALDRRYITKLIESGCGYTRASKIILEAKKKK